MNCKSNPDRPSTEPIAETILVLKITPPDLPNWIEEPYPEAVAKLLFRLILGYLEHPHKSGRNAGYTQAKLLIPLWLALKPDPRHRSVLLGKLSQDLADRKARVREIRAALD